MTYNLNFNFIFLTILTFFIKFMDDKLTVLEDQKINNI